MIVYGVPIDDATLEVAFARCANEHHDGFQLFVLEFELIGLGVPRVIQDGMKRQAVAYRAADRLLQKKRKAGEIEYKGHKWRLTNE